MANNATTMSNDTTTMSNDTTAMTAATTQRAGKEAHDFFTMDPTAHDLILFVLNMVLALSILLGNSLTIAAICRFPELRTQPNLYVLNLAVADSVVGVGCFHVALTYIPFSRETLSNGSAYICTVIFVLTYISCCESLLTLLVMAVDRMVYVVHPYRYPALFTETRTRVFIGLSWLVSLLSGALPAYYNSQVSLCGSNTRLTLTYFRLTLPIQVLVVLVLTSLCYVKIATVACRQRKKIARELRVVQLQGQPRQEDERLWRTFSSSSSYQPPCWPDGHATAPAPTVTSETNNEMDVLEQEAEQQLSRSGVNPAQAVPLNSPSRAPLRSTGLTFSNRSARSGLQSVLLFVIVNCVFALCYLPFAVNCLLLNVVHISDEVSGYLLFLALSNSAMNVVILPRRSKQFARAYRTMLQQLCSFCCCRHLWDP